jgi:hypothetical protein
MKDCGRLVIKMDSLNDGGIMLMDTLKLYCPVLVARISVDSELLDKIGQFTKFILWAISISI